MTVSLGFNARQGCSQLLFILFYLVGNLLLKLSVYFMPAFGVLWPMCSLLPFRNVSLYEHEPDFPIFAENLWGGFLDLSELLWPF
jgi:hypothetical protein